METEEIMVISEFMGMICFMLEISALIAIFAEMARAAADAITAPDDDCDEDIPDESDDIYTTDIVTD